MWFDIGDFIRLFMPIRFYKRYTGFPMLAIAISLAVIAVIIPSLLNVESRSQNFSIKATGVITIIVWLLNLPH